MQVLRHAYYIEDDQDCHSIYSYKYLAPVVDLLTSTSKDLMEAPLLASSIIAQWDGIKEATGAVFDCSSDVREVKEALAASFPADTSVMINGKLQTSIQVAKNDMVVVQKISSESLLPI